MSQGARNWPFLTLMARPVSAAAMRRSVWRQRKAGICRMSATSATIGHCHDSCTSVTIGRLSSFLTRCRICSPRSMPMPRGDETDVRLALSKEDLNINGMLSREQISLSSAATSRVIDSDSMAQGPASRANRLLSPNFTLLVISIIEYW